MKTLAYRLSACLLCLAPSALASNGDTPPSFVVILADDLGVENVRVYDEHPAPARTDRLDQLAEEGLLFRHAYAHPVCSPSRVSMLTGLMPWQTGVGHVIKADAPDQGLGLDVRTYPQILGDEYRRVHLGKWHMNSRAQLSQVQPALHYGFDSFRGTWFNLKLGGNYNSFLKFVDREPGVYVDEYLTTDTIDDAIREVENAIDPLFLVVSLHAPHRPFHVPPSHLHEVDMSNDTDQVRYKAMVEAMDTEIGRLIDALDSSAIADSTYVFFIADNGTAERAATPPMDPQRLKGTCYEGGVRVPLIVRGPGVVTGECPGLVHIADIGATVLELAGRPLEHLPQGTVSMAPYFAGQQASLRDLIYVEMFRFNGDDPVLRATRAIRGPRFKLIDFIFPKDPTKPEEMYDLWLDPTEQNNLLLGGTGTLPQKLLPEYRALREAMDKEGAAFYEQAAPLCARRPSTGRSGA